MPWLCFASQLLHRYGDSVRVDILVRRPVTRHARLRSFALARLA
jgi:hypothetical protein